MQNTQVANLIHTNHDITLPLCYLLQISLYFYCALLCKISARLRLNSFFLVLQQKHSSEILLFHYQHTPIVLSNYFKCFSVKFTRSCLLTENKMQYLMSDGFSLIKSYWNNYGYQVFLIGNTKYEFVVFEFKLQLDNKRIIMLIQYV